MKKNKKAFTLVEVLITIGIIGVVAAITIPTLLQNTNNHKFATRFKKTVSTLAQASLTSQAQYDMDYSSLSQDSNDTTCATDAIAKGNSTMCGLFNNTLAGHSYQGVYGTVKGANLSDPYTISYTTTGFNPEGNLIYALADGTLVGFKPTAKNCRLKPGNVLSSDVITSSEGLVNCVGFIDVNGVQTPNKEVTCSSGTSEFSTSPCFIKSSGNAISDVFPIVFHDGTVEPATNAARAILTRGKSNSTIEEDDLKDLDSETRASVLKMRNIYQKLSEINDVLNAENDGNWTTKCTTFDNICFRNLFAEKLDVQKTCTSPVYAGCQSESHFANGVTFAYNINVNADMWPSIVLNDGTSIKFRFHDNGCEQYHPICGWIQVDTDGVDGPNIVGKDIYFFSFTKNGEITPIGNVDDETNCLENDVNCGYKYLNL